MDSRSRGADSATLRQTLTPVDRVYTRRGGNQVGMRGRNITVADGGVLSSQIAYHTAFKEFTVSAAKQGKEG